MTVTGTETLVEVDTITGRVRGRWRADAAGTARVYDVPSVVAPDAFAGARPLVDR